MTDAGLFYAGKAKGYSEGESFGELCCRSYSGSVLTFAGKFP